MQPGDWKRFRNVVVLTGAGISAESGIKTFRDGGGLWENHRVEDVATPEAFARDPQLVWRFYSLRREAAAEAKPNAAHMALDEFARNFDGNSTLITQNVDTLHERALLSGSADPLCMHGSLEKSRCTACDVVYLDDVAWLSSGASVALLTTAQRASPDALSQYAIKLRDGMPLSPCCQALLRPHIVWFGEMPLLMERILGALSNCDLFVSIGTSGAVYPAAGFIQIAKQHGAHTVCLNLEPIPQSATIDQFVQGTACQLVPVYFNVKKLNEGKIS